MLNYAIFLTIIKNGKKAGTFSNREIDAFLI